MSINRPFERHVLGAPYFIAADVSVNDEAPHIIAGIAKANICQDFVEKIQLSQPRLVLNDAAIFTQAAEVKFAHHTWMYYEGCSTSGRRELFEIPEEQHVHRPTQLFQRV